MDNNENSVGPVVGLIIILAVIILGGLYFWGERNNSGSGDLTSPSTAQSDADTAAIEAQSSSDDVDSIQGDLNNTNTETLDADLNAI